MWIIVDDFFKVLLKDFHPCLHQMYVLEHAPVTCFSSFLECLDSVVFLTLSHGDVNEGTIRDLLAICCTNQFDFWSWINTREKHEEDGSLDICFWICCHDVKWLLLYIFFAHVLSDELSQSICESVWSKCSQK